MIRQTLLLSNIPAIQYSIYIIIRLQTQGCTEFIARRPLVVPYFCFGSTKGLNFIVLYVLKFNVLGHRHIVVHFAAAVATKHYE